MRYEAHTPIIASMAAAYDIPIPGTGIWSPDGRLSAEVEEWFGQSPEALTAVNAYLQAMLGSEVNSGHQESNLTTEEVTIQEPVAEGQVIEGISVDNDAVEVSAAIPQSGTIFTSKDQKKVQHWKNTRSSGLARGPGSAALRRAQKIAHRRKGIPYEKALSILNTR